MSGTADQTVTPRKLAPPRRSWSHAILLLIGLAGTLTSVGMYRADNGWRADEEELRFVSQASDYLRTVSQGLQEATELLYPVRAFFESVGHPVTRTEFQAFSRRVWGRLPGLYNIGWAPRVTAAERARFERNIRATGLPDFQITERNAEGRLVRAADRAEYFPIVYLEPGGSRTDIGFDVASDATQQRALASALSTDRLTVAPPLKLGYQAQTVRLSFIPVGAPVGAGDEHPHAIAGIVLGVDDTAAMIDTIRADKVRLAALDMYVFDPNGTPGDRLISWHSAAGGPAPPEAALLAKRHLEATLELADQRWGVILTPAYGTADNAGDPEADAFLAGGLLMTLAIVAYLWHSQRRTLRLERIANQLRQTTDELRQNGAKLDHLARHDALTGLLNRMAFREDLAGALRRARRGQAMALLYLDLDRFKAVNDTLGHPAGDELLCEVAARLRQTVREADTISRLGGDEFAIAQTGAEQPASAENLARRLIDSLSQRYRVGGQWVVIGVSVGITVAERDDSDVDQLLRRADMALYAAKREGRGTWRFFASTMDSEAQAMRGLEMDLRHALEHEELELYYQPQVALADGRVQGFEALLRWHHPRRGMVMPGDFLRCAEETGLITALGNWALRTALKQSAEWPKELRVAVNLSPHQLTRDDLVETIEAALTASGQTADRLELEITEHALKEQYLGGQTALKRLQEMGVRLSMDDFGTGHSSLSQLRSFPFDRIKVDQSFVAAMTESPQGNAIVRAILQLADTLNIATVAEGVETPAQMEQLAAMGCDEVQGFLFSPAVAASAVLELLKNWMASGSMSERQLQTFSTDPRS